MNLHERQLELENLSVDLGIDRYTKQRPMPWRTDNSKRKEEADMQPGKELVRRSIEPFTKAIEELVKRVREGKAGRGRPAVAVKYISQFDPQTVAFIAARRIISAAAQVEGLTATAVSIATMMEDHYRFEEFSRSDPGLYRHTLNKLKKTTHHGHRRGVLKHALKLTSVKGLEWTKEEQLHTGLKLVELFVSSTGLVEVHCQRNGGKTKDVVRFVPKTAEWLEKQHARCALFAPIHLPMVVPPRPWTNPTNGGYLKPNRLMFVKTQRRETIDELFSTEMPAVYDAVNYIQSTAWRINRGVLDVMREAWDRGMAIAGLPLREPKPLPCRPHDIPENVAVKDLTGDQQARLKAWAVETAKVHQENALLVGKRLTVMQQLWVGETFAEYKDIYFPHTIDFRGRIYAVPPLVNPQADDIGRSLLEFARGKRVGETGGYWLAVLLANLYGFDKAGFDERVAWTFEHEEKILECVAAPLENLWWTEADNPWQFLAACFEWAGFLAMGEDYVSHLPVHMDGTCSGLQHFSALLRNEQSARAVNLCPMNERQDIYQIVADRVSSALRDSCDQLAALWQGKVTRRIVKRPTMTFAYSVTSRGMRDQILDEMGKASAGGENYLSPDVRDFVGANYLAPLVNEAIRSTVVAAAGAMDWLQKVVTIAAKNNLPVRWTAPSGLPVLQANFRVREKRVKCNYAGVSKFLTLAIETDTVDPKRQSFAVAPNYIHSLDAAHLCFTVLGGVENGLRDFAMIHDSFGVHAADIDILHAVIRNEFVRLYSVNRLAEFRDQIAAQLPPDIASEIPPLPPMGDLDLEQVRDSDFFFS